MRKIFIVIYSLFIFPSCIAPIWETDTMYIKHWERKPNSCIYFFDNDQFVGFLLDGNKLKETDIFLQMGIKHITQIDLDTTYSYNYNIRIDTLTIKNFEEILKDTLEKNDSLLLADPPHLSANFYFRQYLGFYHNNKKYLFVSFQVNEDNLILTDDGQYKLKNREDRIYKRYELIYSRYFLPIPLDQWKRVNNPFYVLYDIDTKEMEFFFIGKRMKN